MRSTRKDVCYLANFHTASLSSQIFLQGLVDVILRLGCFLRGHLDRRRRQLGGLLAHLGDPSHHLSEEGIPTTKSKSKSATSSCLLSSRRISVGMAVTLLLASHLLGDMQILFFLPPGRFRLGRLLKDLGGGNARLGGRIDGFIVSGFFSILFILHWLFLLTFLHHHWWRGLALLNNSRHRGSRFLWGIKN